MPYEWVEPTGEAPPRVELHLWPYRSLSRRGFVRVISLLAVGLSLPLLGLLGHPSLWLFLPILLGTVGLLWFFIDRSYRDGEILEVLKIWPDQIILTRDGPRGAHADWEANPYWVTVRLHPEAGPVKNYVTLKGNEREVEIGAFLSEDERPALYDELAQALRDVKTAS
ncbi:DUF2244 domain-containing protein [Aliiroseovarius crassostreae]|uniref:DUF2244 domain-containing protein n=1 Tax=Aliiroseovarius crassostreae TaxID=154981 RepID=UPI003C7CE884